MDELSTEPRPEGPGSGDPGGVDLTPRVPPAVRRRRRAPWAWVALAGIVAALLVVVFNGLGDATLFFRTAEEAVAQRDSLGDRRFRIEGRVDGDSITPTDRGVDFVITSNGVDVAVSHQGDPPDLFQPTIPVVLEGRWARAGDPEVVSPDGALPTDDGWFFASDEFLVKHEEEYIAENPERTDVYDEDDTGARGATEGSSSP